MRRFPKAGWLSQSKLLLACIVTLPLLAACITSDNPLSSEKFQDPAILGEWHTEENPRSPVDLSVSTVDGGDYKAVETTWNAEGGPPKLQTYLFSLTKGATRNYVNMRDSKGYMIFTYVLKDKQLHLRALDYEKLKTAVTSGLMKADTNETTWGRNMQIHETGPKLLALLEQPNGDQYFGNALVYDRKIPDADLIKGVLQSQADAWNKGDLKAFMSAYLNSPDVSYVSSDGELTGYEALLQRYQNKYGDKPETMGKLSFSNLKVQQLGMKNAMAVGNWRVERSGQPELNGIFTLVLSKTDDGWKLIHDHTSVLTAPKK
jgi:ketosteroid isomerase-like protein